MEFRKLRMFFKLTWKCFFLTFIIALVAVLAINYSKFYLDRNFKSFA